MERFDGVLSVASLLYQLTGSRAATSADARTGVGLALRIGMMWNAFLDRIVKSCLRFHRVAEIH